MGPIDIGKGEVGEAERERTDTREKRFGEKTQVYDMVRECLYGFSPLEEKVKSNCARKLQARDRRSLVHNHLAIGLQEGNNPRVIQFLKGGVTTS